jgi:hypothetical protein
VPHWHHANRQYVDIAPARVRIIEVGFENSQIMELRSEGLIGRVVNAREANVHGVYSRDRAIDILTW